LAQRSSRKRRKARRQSPAGGGYERSRAKNEAARARLEPLAEGERPAAVTVAGIVAAVLGAANLIGYVAGVDVRGEQPQVLGVLLYSGLMFVAAWGCFRVRYWAVLGMQALLALGVLIFALLAVKAENVVALAIALLVIALSGALFWFLVKAMARIQMPERPHAR